LKHMKNKTPLQKSHPISRAFVWSLLLVLVIVTVAFSAFQPANASSSARIAGFAPTDYKADTSYGQGVFIAGHRIELFETPTASEPYEILEWQKDNDIHSIRALKQEAFLPAKNLFIVFYPQADLAILPAISESENGWVEVLVDQRQKKTAWVKSTPIQQQVKPQTQQTDGVTPTTEVAPATASEELPLGRYQTWQEFMRQYAKANGIFWLSGVPEYHRHIRQAPVDSAKMVNILIVRSLKVRHVRGNWMLVEAVDFNHSMPMGWLRWRDEEGRLLIFANFTGLKSTIYMTGN
jgi:hypothetical protein